MMEEIIKLVVDNGIAVACFIAFIYFIFVDKKESNELFKEQNNTLKEISKTQTEMHVTLKQLNDRVEKLEKEKWDDAMRCPVNYISITQEYGTHKGVDFGWYDKNHHHQWIYAAQDGVVIYNRHQISGGYVIHIKHDNGYV